MYCIVKIPDQIPSTKTQLYKQSAYRLFRQLNSVKDKISSIFAVGPSHFASLWPGEFLESNSAPAKLSETMSDKASFFVGLDAPFLSVDTINKFIDRCYDLNNDSSTIPICTFRETPKQKNPALIEVGGNHLCSIKYSHGDLKVNIETCQESEENTVQNVNINFAERELRINSLSQLYIDWTAGYAENNVVKGNRGHCDKSYTSLSSPNQEVVIKIDKDCEFSISEILQDTRLYSKIHYTLPPLTIKGLVRGSMLHGRINEQTGEFIHGRQAVPQVFEPFLGLISASSTSLTEQLLLENNLCSFSQYVPIIVPSPEASLISDDAMQIAYNFSQSEKANSFISGEAI